MSQFQKQKTSAPVKAPEPARIVEALKAPEAPIKFFTPKWVKIADASFGLALIDPTHLGVYTHAPTPVMAPSPWVDDALKRGILVEV
jgi:hypothetical protein